MGDEAVIGFLLVLTLIGGRVSVVHVYDDPGSCMLRAQAAVNEVGYETAKCIVLLNERGA
jgi:hypothetical protein